MLLVVAIVTFVWISGLIYYVISANSSKIDDHIVTDAIVLFTGGNETLSAGIALLSKNYGPILFIPTIESSSQLKNFLIEKNVSQDQVLYGMIKSGISNSEEIADFIFNYNVKSIRLVALSYQLHRAVNEIELLTPGHIVIVPHPIFTTYVDYMVWIQEYYKYLKILINKYHII
jgi:hypothetical protein